MATLQENPTMGLPKPKTLFTVDEYLLLERAAEERHLFLDGVIYVMAGESGAHGDVSASLFVAFGSQLKGTDCRPRTKDTKVRSGAVPLSGYSMRGMFSYPDVVVICGEPEYHDAYKDVILNPKVIAEVLSPTTEDFDRGEKFTRYRTFNPTLSDYILVSQDQPQIEHFSKQADGEWSSQVYTGLEAVVPIHSIQCTLKLADVYDRITFPDE